MTTDSSGDAAIAIAAATAGARVLTARFGGDLLRIPKGGGDFATEADLAAEQAIMEVLRTERPADALVGEETGRTGSPQARREWLVDPLCGTLNYAAGTPLASVNVALRTDGEVVAAAVADPFAGEVMWIDGAAAWRRRGGADEPIEPSPVSHLVDVNVDPPMPNRDWFRADLLLGRLAGVGLNPRVLSTTLALAWVACGRRAAYVTDGRLLDSVHFAAGIALCQAAGCVVTGLLGESVHTGTGGLIAAADAESHAALVALVTEQRASAAAG